MLNEQKEMGKQNGRKNIFSSKKFFSLIRD